MIWTTTPWTIPFNLGVMVHPELEYVKVGEEVWIVAKALADTFIRAVAEREYSILAALSGGTSKVTSIPPLYELLKPVYDDNSSISDKAFSVVLSDEYVDLSAGSGLVHIAPGCGPEDFEVGRREGIPAFNNLDDYGVFPLRWGSSRA